MTEEMERGFSLGLVGDAIALERARQEKRWGQQEHEPLKYQNIVAEEFWEVFPALQTAVTDAWEDGPYEDIGGELVQLAACCVAMLEAMVRNQGLSIETVSHQLHEGFQAKMGATPPSFQEVMREACVIIEERSAETSLPLKCGFVVSVGMPVEGYWFVTNPALPARFTAVQRFFPLADGPPNLTALVGDVLSVLFGVDPKGWEVIR